MTSYGNKETLASLKNGLAPTHGLDAKLAATYVDCMLITTPNESFIPHPPSGVREVFLRADLRYGMDDAILWPQFYLESYPHLAAIPRRPEDSSDPLAVLWWTPRPSNFVPSLNTGIYGLGLIQGEEMDALEERKDSLFQEVRKYLDSHPSPMLRASFSVTAHSWVRLRTLPGKSEEKFLELAEFQRNWLEFRAAFDFESIYVPRIHSNMMSVPKVDHRVGCFTTKPLIAQEFFSAGLPVWYIRPLESVGAGTNIFDIASIVDAKAHLHLDRRPNQHYPVIYRGPADDPQLYIAQHKFTRSRVVFINPISGKIVKNPTPQEALSLRFSTHTRSMASLRTEESIEHKKRGFQPYDRSQRPKRSKDTAPSGRDKFVEIELPTFPPPSTVWASALRNVKNSTDKEFRAEIKYEAYSVPDPGLFSTSNQRKKFMENWLRTRESWLWRITSRKAVLGDSTESGYIPTKVWRDLLCHGFPDRDSLVASADSSPSSTASSTLTGASYNAQKTASEKRLRRFLSVKEALFGSDGELQAGEKNEQVTWRGAVVPFKDGELDIEEIQSEVLWELYEINFRCDLLTVDCQLARSKWETSDEGGLDSLDRSLAIYKCFYGGEDVEFTFLPPKIPDRNVGLVSNKATDYLPYAIALARIILDWDIPVNPIIGEVLGLANQGTVTDIKAFRFSRAVADVYCAGVYRVLGRAAVTPHRIRK